MLNRTGLCVLLAIAGAGACGGASDNDFGDSPGGGRATTGGSSGSAGAKATGGTGTGGSATGGTSGKAGAGSGGTGGSATGGTGTGGSAGSAVGGTGTGGSATGGTGTGGSAGNGSGGTGGGAAGTGMTTGGSSGVGGTAGTGSMPTCKEISAQYDAALIKAQVCNPSSGKEQCTHSVAGLGCDCPVFANPENESALAELNRLQKLSAATCPVAICPAIACVLPESGTCVADASDDKEDGHCVTGLGTPL